MGLRTAGAGLLLVAIIPLVIAVFGKGWLRYSSADVEMSFGLLGGEVCRSGECKGGPWAEQKKGSRKVDVITFAGYGAVGLTMVLSLILALVGARHLIKKETSRRSALVVCAASVLGLAGATGSLAVLQRLASRLARADLPLELGSSAYLFIGGAATALLGGILLWKGGRGKPSTASNIP